MSVLHDIEQGIFKRTSYGECWVRHVYLGRKNLTMLKEEARLLTLVLGKQGDYELSYLRVKIIPVTLRNHIGFGD